MPADLGDWLKYGPSGLALAVLAVVFYSLRSLQHDALNKDVPEDRVKSIVSLHVVYLFAAVGMFCFAVVGQRYFVAPVNNTHRIAFMLSPTRYDSTDLAPRLTVAGGSPISFQDGMGKDDFAGERAYQIDVGELVNQNRSLATFYQQWQLHAQMQGGVDGR